MIKFPNAKINLGLNITEKRADGYHNLETVFYPIPIEDALEVIEKEPEEGNKIKLYASGLVIADDPENNLVVKAYHLLDKEYNLPSINIYLHKKIPFGAGLGGGSSDAAYMLKLLNEKFNLNLTTKELETYAAKLGADCAFFIENKPVFAEGIGNLFSPIPLSLSGYGLMVVKPDVFVSTRDAFSGIKPRKPQYPLKEIVLRPVEEWKEYMFNDFEESIFPKFPAIQEIKEKLYDLGAVYASMSGSGSSVYGLFKPNSILTDEYFKDSFCFHCTLE